MSYRVRIDPWDWAVAEGRAGLEQCVALALDEARRLRVHVVLRPRESPQIAGAWIEQSYITRREGRKWRIVERVPPQRIELEARER